MLKIKFVLALLLLLAMCAAGCKSETVEEEFGKTHTKPGQEILYKGMAEEKPFVLYKAPFDNGKTGVGLAVFQGSEDKGWNLYSSNAMVQDSRLAVDSVGVDFGNKGRKHFVYGYIQDPDITLIELTDNANRTLKADIIETGWKRLWYALLEMEELRLKAFDGDHDVVVEVPYRPVFTFTFGNVELQTQTQDGRDESIPVKDDDTIRRIYELLQQAEWSKAKIAMDGMPDYKLKLDVRDPYESWVYAIWQTPKKDRLEIVMLYKNRTTSLSEEQSKELKKLLGIFLGT